MATKNYEQMTTKKLNALKASANEQELAAIEAVLAAREQAQKPNGLYEAEPEEALTPEQEAIVAEAEANGGKVKASSRMTDDERKALAEELKVNIGHKCQVVPFNTVEWVNGYIAGIMEEKRANKVLFAIKTEDGRRIVKVHDSKLLRIFEEVVTIEKKPRSYKTGEPKGEWTSEAIDKALSEVMGNVGKTVTFVQGRGEENSETITGRITGLVPEKRAQTVLYRIEVSAPTEENPDAVKVMHKTIGSSSLVIAEEFDEEGAKFNAKYVARREKALSRVGATPEDRVAKCEENLKKAIERLEKIQEEVKARTEQLEEAKQELAAYHASLEKANAETQEESLS